MSEIKPLVAIHCLVYNHEPYLRECFEGFVMQQTNFPFVAIVHDDASTDGSAAIIREYEEKYPHIFKPIYEQENLYQKGGFGTINEVMNEAIGATGAKYVAMCEGDDYWTDSYKLQKQVDFMEANEDVGICYTDYNHSNESANRIYNSMFEQQHKYRPETYEQHLIKPGYLAPMTWVMRRELMSAIEYPPSYTDGTYVMMLTWLRISNVVYIPEVTAVYRSHVGSASSPIGYAGYYKYSKGVSDTQLYFAEHFPCNVETRKTIQINRICRLLPIAILAGQDDFIVEAKVIAEKYGLNIENLVRELKNGAMARSSYAYRIGKIILRPLSFIIRLLSK